MGGASALRTCPKSPFPSPSHNGACGESQLELGRWGQVEGGNQLPGAQRGAGHSPLSFPLPASPFLRPSGPATHPELEILGARLPPLAPFSTLWGKFFQAAPPGPS